MLNRHWIDNEGNHQGGVSYGDGFAISWQHGALNIVGRNGAYPVEVIEAVISRVEHFQEGKFACDENAEGLRLLKLAVSQFQARLDRRKAEGTLGTHEV